MPTTSDNFGVYIPRRVQVFRNGNAMAPIKTTSPMTAKQFIPFGIAPPSSSIKSTKPREIKTSMDDVEEIESKKKKTRRVGFWLGLLLALLALAIIGALIAVAIILNMHATTTSTTTTTTSVVMNSSMSVTTITTAASVVMTSSMSVTTTVTVITTTVNCVSPYVLASSGSCVNILIDPNNCGSVGHNCSPNYTSCSAGVCSSAPSVQLVGGSFIWTAAINGSVDDNYFGVIVPFNITLYTTTTNFVYVTTNGVLCLGNCASTYTETALPATYFPGATAFPYWDDLYIYASTSQGIYYGTEGTAPNRTLIFEFYTSHYLQPTQYYHFQVIFFEGLPGIVEYKYFQATDGGVSCTVGVQASRSGPFIQYSFDLANSVRSNMSLTFNTILGTYTNSTF